MLAHQVQNAALERFSRYSVAARSHVTRLRTHIIGPLPCGRWAVYCNCRKQEALSACTQKETKAEEVNAQATFSRSQLVEEKSAARLVLRRISDKMQESPRSHIVYMVGPNLQRGTVRHK
jgi:hypothetical protein